MKGNDKTYNFIVRTKASIWLFQRKYLYIQYRRSPNYKIKQIKTLYFKLF